MGRKQRKPRGQRKSTQSGKFAKEVADAGRRRIENRVNNIKSRVGKPEGEGTNRSIGSNKILEKKLMSMRWKH